MIHSSPGLSLNDSLLQFAPFNELDASYVQKIRDHADIISEPKGKLLFKRGKTHAYKYYLLSGSVDLITANFTKEPVIAGEERGLRPLNELSPSQVSAVTLEPSQLLRVESDFLDLAMLWNQSANSQRDADLSSSGDSQTGESVPLESESLGGLALSSAKFDESEDQSDWMSELISSPLFTQVPPAHIQQLFARFERLPCRSGQMIIHEGESGDYFYVIHEGHAEVTNLTGKLKVKLGSGQFFGEEALVADAPRNASVMMLTDGTLMRLSKNDFVDLLHKPVQKEISLASYQGNESAYTVIDIRLPIEHKGVHVPGSKNIPLATLRDRLPQLDPEQQYIVTDDGGRRSSLAAYLMCQAGYETYILEMSDQLYNTAS